MRENVRANLRRMVKRVLRKHGYPPDQQDQATQTVLQQAELLGLEAATVPEPAEILPFRRLLDEEARPYENCIPLYSLEAAAGAFGEGREVEPEGWVEPNGGARGPACSSRESSASR